MYAMQYEIDLPAGYDMQIIRKRVAERGRMTDAFDGLGIKAYLIRERGKGGATRNEYSPFYLWNDTAGMNRFLWEGAGFHAIVESFGRQVVQTWSGLVCVRGNASASNGASMPLAATRLRTPLAIDADLAQIAREAAEEATCLAARPGVFASAAAIDPRTWERVAFTLWASTPNADVPGERYEVLHLSRPGFDEVTTQRR